MALKNVEIIALAVNIPEDYKTIGYSNYTRWELYMLTDVLVVRATSKVPAGWVKLKGGDGSLMAC